MLRILRPKSLPLFSFAPCSRAVGADGTADMPALARKQSLSGKGAAKNALAALEPVGPLVCRPLAFELPLPLGIGLSAENVVTEVSESANEVWRQGDRLCWVDGFDVRGGKAAVGEVIDRNRPLHALVINRDVEPTPGVLYFTVRLTGTPGLGIGVSEDNRVTDLSTSGVAAKDGRLQSGDALLCFDGHHIEDGRRQLSACFNPQINPHELVVRRYLQPPPPPPTPLKGASAKDKAAAKAAAKAADAAAKAPCRFTTTLAALPDADKKGKHLPFTLDKKGAISEVLSSACRDELMVGDVLIDVDGKKAKDPLAKINKALDPKTTVHSCTFERTPPVITEEEYAVAQAMIAQEQRAHADGAGASGVASSSKPPPPPNPPPAAAPAPPPTPAPAVTPAVTPAATAVTTTAPPTSTPAPSAPTPAVAPTGAPSAGAAKEFHFAGWSNSAKAFKAVCSATASSSPPALLAGLPSNLDLKYVKRDELDAAAAAPGGLVAITMVVSNDPARVAALQKFFADYNRVAQMDLPDGGAFFLEAYRAENGSLACHRTPPKGEVGAATTTTTAAPAAAASTTAASTAATPSAQPTPAATTASTATASASTATAAAPTKPAAVAAPAALPTAPAAAPKAPPAAPPATAAAAAPPPTTSAAPPTAPPAAPTATGQPATPAAKPAAASAAPSLSAQAQLGTPQPAQAQGGGAPKPGVAPPLPTKPAAPAGVGKLATGIAGARMGASPGSARDSGRTASGRRLPPTIPEEDASVADGSKPSPDVKAPASQTSAEKPAATPVQPTVAPSTAATPATVPRGESSSASASAAAATAANPTPLERTTYRPSGAALLPPAPAPPKPKPACVNPLDTGALHAQTPSRGASSPAAGAAQSERAPRTASAFHAAGTDRARTYRKEMVYPQTPAVWIGVNQQSRSPTRARSPNDPAPAGGLFNFQLPMDKVRPSAREAFLSDRKQTPHRKPEELGLKEIDEEEYITPRLQIAQQKAERTKQDIAISGQGSGRINKYKTFYEQFNAALSA